MLTCANQSDAVEARHGIKGIDHPVIAVRDMEAAREVFQRLGFVVPPRGSHVEWGTGNWCIMFPEDYLELRGIVDPTRPIMGLDTVLESKGEGLMGIARSVSDLAKTAIILMKNFVPFRTIQNPNRLRVCANYACGTIVEFVES